MKKSIFLKTSLAFLCVIALISTLILVASVSMMRSFYLDSLTDDLENVAIALGPTVMPLLDADRTAELDSLVKKLGSEMRTRITVIAPDGTVLADSEEDPLRMENHGSRIEILRALGGHTGTAARYSTTMGEEMLYVAIPLRDEENLKGVLRASLFIRDIHDLYASLRGRILETGLIIVALTLCGALMFSRTLSRRIRQLSLASQRLARGEFDARVSFRTRDEFGELAENFNHMASTMKDLFERVSAQKEGLDRILASIREGLVLIDRNGSILLTNEGFRNIAGDAHMEGKTYWQVLREPGFVDLVEEMRREGGSVTKELVIRDRVFLSSATILRPNDEIVIMLHDITEIRKLEQIKKDFVINVSHELRTPLSIIKGFAETLRDEKDLENDNHLRIIIRHTDRLVSIVNDLLLLSALEQKETRLRLEEVDVRELIMHILGIFHQRLEEKGLEVKVEADGELPVLRADPSMLEQLFINLLDNAIKYTEEGWITVLLSALGDRICIRISDTGIGIPEEHRSRIFERFYVADKSRSRKVGGTGLGLSIVKHIVSLHRGQITVDSLPGKGSCFTIILPLDPQGNSSHKINTTFTAD